MKARLVVILSRSLVFLSSVYPRFALFIVPYFPSPLVAIHASSHPLISIIPFDKSLPRRLNILQKLPKLFET
jgi:hypothetical protein